MALDLSIRALHSSASAVSSPCLATLTTGEVRYQLVRAVYDYQMVLYRRLILPVTVGGESVDMLLIASVRTRRLADLIAAGRELG